MTTGVETLAITVAECGVEKLCMKNFHKRKQVSVFSQMCLSLSVINLCVTSSDEETI